MNSIPPHMLGLSNGMVTVLKTPAEAAPRIAAPQWFWRLALRWRWVLAGSVAGGAAIGCLATVLMTRQYAATVELQIARETAQVVTVGALGHDVSIGDQEFYQTQYALLRAHSLAERVARDIGADNDPGFFAMFGKRDAYSEHPGATASGKRREIAGDILLDHVVVAPVHGSSLVDVEATTPSPALSEKIARFWGQDFIAGTLERRQDAASDARRFLEAQITELRDKLETSERRAVEFAASQGMIDLTLPGGSQKPGNDDSGQARLLVTDDLVAMNTARDAAAAERIQAASRLAAVGDQPGSSSNALAYRALGLLRKQRADIAAGYAAALAQPASGDTAAKALHARLDAIDAAIQAEVQRVHSALAQDYQAALAREQAMGQRVDALKASLAEQRQRAIQYAIFRRDADSNRALYEALLQRAKEIGIAGAVESNNVAVVGTARVPDRPASPRLVVNLGLFTLAGAIAGMIAALILNRMDRGVADPDEFEEKLGLKLLGVVPPLGQQTPIAAFAHARSAFGDAHLEMTANLLLATGTRSMPHSLAIIGTRPGEGATTTAIVLASTLARTGRKVLLIDADLRAPSLHAAFGLQNDAGLAGLLSRGAEAGSMVRATEHEGLSIICAGDAPDLLVSGGLPQLVKELQGRFDHVIIDCPSIASHAEAPLIAAAAAGCVYVVAACATPLSMLRGGLARLGGAAMLGGVLTMHDPGYPSREQQSDR
jgi:succinoglycan biosynthesis transport protein ExoP